MKNLRIRLVLSLVVLAIGILLSASAFRAVPGTETRLRRKAADVKVLNTLLDMRRADWAAVSTFEQLPELTPRTISDVVAQARPGVQPSIQQRDPRPAVAGWRIRSATLNFDDIAATDLARFMELASADTERPPWVVVECNINASDTKPGHARATLTLEALEKKDETR